MAALNPMPLSSQNLAPSHFPEAVKGELPDESTYSVTSHFPLLNGYRTPFFISQLGESKWREDKSC